MTMVSKHFSVDEFAQRAWSGGPRRVYPSKWVTPRLTPLCEALELIREELGGKPMSILSGYRSAEYNRAIKGARLSQHVEGRAADVRVAGVPAERVHAVAMLLSDYGLIPQIRGIGLYPSFVHFDVRPTVRLVRWGGEWTPSES